MPEQRLILATSREGVVLRQFVEADAVPLFALVDRNRPHLSQWDDQTSAKYPDLASAQASINAPRNPKKLRFGIWEGDVLVGTVNLTPHSNELAEVGYWVGREFGKRGLATIATVALVRYARRAMRFRRITAATVPANIASRKVLLKAGFRIEYEGTDHCTFSFP